MRWTPEDFAEAIGVFRREIAGSIRRVVVNLTDGGAWRVIGHVLFTDREGKDAEHYPGIGWFARPPAGSESAEGIVLQVGGANQPALVATRDEATRAKVADVENDESCGYNSQCRLYLKKDGTIEARTHAGAAVALALKSDVQTVRNELHHHEHEYVPGSSGVATTTGGPSVSSPVGTTKLKGE